MADPTAKDVAAWMATKAAETNMLYQELVVYEIQSLFGKEFVYDNEAGNLAINKTVLKHFRELTPDLVWDPSERAWRKREAYDGDGRQAE